MQVLHDVSQSSPDWVRVLFGAVRMEFENLRGVRNIIPVLIILRVEMCVQNEVGCLFGCGTGHCVLTELCHLCGVVEFQYNITFF